MVDFPLGVLEKIPGDSKLSTFANELLTGYSENKEDCDDGALSNFHKSFLTQVLAGTRNLKKPLQLKKTLNAVQKEKNYTHQTMRKLLFELNRFVDYCRDYHQNTMRFRAPLLKGEIAKIAKKHQDWRALRPTRGQRNDNPSCQACIKCPMFENC